MRPNNERLMIMVLSLVLTPAARAITWYVNGVSGSDSNNCLTSTTACKTVGHAISLAASGDSIVIAASTYYANVTININLNILGSGASTTILYGGGFQSHGPVFGPVVSVSAGATVSLSNLTVTGGYTGSGAGIRNKGTLTITNSTISKNEVYALAPWGGGISNSGMLAINNSTITGNIVRATYITENTPGGGGGILNTGGLTINNSTLSFNTSWVNDASGGGIYNSGTAKINNTTLSGNGAGGLLIASGGGISNTGTLTINNSTLSGNSARSQRGPASGGGVSNGGTLKINNSTLGGNGAFGITTSVGGGISSYQGLSVLKNSVVANSSSGGNCHGNVTSNGYNLSSDTTCSFSGPGDRNNINPLLGPLQNNGGRTQTMALTSGSPAIDAGNPAGCTDALGHLLQTDQRGMPRPDKEDSGGCDMGAYESQSD